MTTPGGVPNLPVGALTLDTLASRLQDTSGSAMKSRAVERFPGIFNSTTGLSPALDITPFGILTGIFSEVNSLIANANPADVQGPNDIPALVIKFIEGLPLIGQFVDLVESILGGYTGSDPTLIAIGNIFAPVLKLVGEVQQVIDALVGGLSGSTNTGNDPTSLALALINQGLALPLQVIDQINASLAALQAQLNGVQNSPAGTVVSDDFATVGVGGYTNIVGTLAVSASGPYVQTQNVAVGYRNAAQLTDKHGAQITIDGTMHGCSGIGICSDTTASNYAALFVYSGFGGDSIWLSTGSGPKLSVIQAQADQILPRVSNTNVYETWYEPSVNTFHVLRNGVSIITWVDTTNIVTHSSTKRRILLFSNVFDRTEVGFRSPGIRKVNPYDKA